MMTQPALVYLCNQIFKKINIEIDLVVGNQKKDTSILINGLYILRRVLELSNRAYQTNMENERETESFMLKQIIWNSTQYFEVMVKYNIEDEILVIVNEFVKNSSTIVNSDPLIALLPRFIKSFEASHYVGNHYFYFFNTFLILNS